MSIIELKNISEHKKKIFTELIFKNFEHITQFPKLKHTKQDIFALLNDTNNFFIIYLKGQKILSYVVGCKLFLNNRRILFITYIYTSLYHRNMGLGQKMMNYLEIYAQKINLNTIMLTCDTYDKKVYDWYLKMGYMPDMQYRTYDRHDTLSKLINI